MHFGGHLDSGETPEQAELSVPMEQLQLLEGQDMSLVSAEELLGGAIWSAKLGTHRPLADGLLEVMQHVLTRQVKHNKVRRIAPGRLLAQPWCSRGRRSVDVHLCWPRSRVGDSVGSNALSSQRACSADARSPKQRDYNKIGINNPRFFSPPNVSF